MTQRVLVISIEEQADGRKRSAQKQFPVDGFKDLPAATAGEGFLVIVSQLMAELDGSSFTSAAAATPPPAPEPPPKPSAFAPGKKFGGARNPPAKKEVAKEPA